MHYQFRNVNHAFSGLVEALINTGEAKQTNKGEVWRMPNGPTTVTYSRPLERVLFNPVRDCNPFFHLFESLWMLAGRNDVEALAVYNKRMKEFSDDGEIFNGAYGFRWRHYFGVDQLKVALDQLNKDHLTRQCVVQMWSTNDLLQWESEPKDLPCNLSVLFEVDQMRLNMTVYNRSNDLVWGMCGANVVHFSYLQEYMASRLNVGMGKYHQVSNNLHAYNNEHWKGAAFMTEHHTYPSGAFTPLVSRPDQFDEEVWTFVENQDALVQEPFLKDVAAPMCLAFRHHKEREYPRAYEALDRVIAADWQLAGRQWISRRQLAFEARANDVAR